MWRFTIKVKWWIQPFVEIHMDYLPFEGWRWFSKYKSQKKILVICEMDRKGFGIRHEITPKALFECRNVKRVQFHRWLVSTITFVNIPSKSPTLPLPNQLLSGLPTFIKRSTSLDFLFVFNWYIFSLTRGIGSTIGTQVMSDQVTVPPIVFILRNSNGF